MSYVDVNAGLRRTLNLDPFSCKVLINGNNAGSSRTLNPDPSSISCELSTYAILALPPDSRFLYHILHDLRIRQILWMRLLVNLHDTDRVRASITDGRRAESHNSPTAEFTELSVLLGNLGPQEIVCCEPG